MAAIDATGAGFGEPASSAFPIIPDNTNDLPYVTRGIYVGGTGALVVMLYFGAIVTFAAVPVGTIVPVRARKVYTASTATLLLGLL